MAYRHQVKELQDYVLYLQELLNEAGIPFDGDSVPQPEDSQGESPEVELKE